MIENLIKKVVEKYSIIHHPINIKGDETNMCFDGTQRPIEFFEAWKIIDENIPSNDKISFLEIGAAKGLWAIAFIEWCKINKKYPIYTTVTLMTDINNYKNIDGPTLWNSSLPNVEKYYEGQCDWTLIDANSHLQTTKDKVIKVLNKYDFVFIDGDHEYNGVFQDIKNYASLAKKLLMFHDITGYYIDKVRQAILDHGFKFDYEIITQGSSQGIGIIKIEK